MTLNWKLILLPGRCRGRRCNDAWTWPGIVAILQRESI